MDKKKVLLVLETRNDIISYFRANLEKLGYDVATFPAAIFEPYQLTVRDKIKNIIFKYLGAKNTSLDRKKDKHYQNYLEESKKDPFKASYEYSIIFRPDLLENSFLEKIKSISKKMIAFQWDGIERYPAILEKVSLFDHFFCFNPEDETDTIKFLPNFYFDHFSMTPKRSKFDITYIGYYYDDRFNLLEKLGSDLQNKRLNFLLRPFNDEQILRITNSHHVKFIKQIYSYQKLLTISNQSKVLLDIKHPSHSGLSFRFFEGMFLQKKIITTNDSVSAYDFFDPDNIFILNDSHTAQDLRAFLEKSYRPLEKSLIYKYSFTNWFNILTDSENKIPIGNPLNKSFHIS